MARTYYTVLTGYGSQQFASAIASNRPLNVTHFAVGDGNGRAVTPDSTRTTLVREVHRAPVSSISLDPRNNRQVIFELTLPETVGGFWIREMGLFDSAGRLIAYANCPDSFKPRLEENSGKIQVLRMILLVSSSNAVTLNVDNRVIWATRGQLTPKKLTATTRNEVQEDGHTHEIERGDTTKAGLIQLTNDTGLDSEALALSAKGGKAIAQSVAQLQQRLNDGLNQKFNKTDISDAVNSESRTTVASSKAVKTAYDKGVEAKNIADGKVGIAGTETITGEKTFHYNIKIRSRHDASKFGRIGQNGDDLFIQNGYTGYYLTLKNDGELRYREWAIHHEKRAYVSVNATNGGYSGLNITRVGTSGSWVSRIEALPDRRWKFWTNSDGGGFEQYIPAKNGTIAFMDDVNARVSKSGDTMTGALKSKHIGVDAYNRQYRTDAPFLVEANSDSARNNFHPFIKGKMRSLGNYGGSFSFGWTSHQGDGNGFGKGAIVWAGDNAETINGQCRVWSFETNGDFISAGDVQSSGGKSLNQAVMLSDISYQKIGNFEIRKYPDGTMIQTCRFTPQNNRFGVQMSNNNTLIWPIAFYETPKVWAQYVNTDSNEFGSTDSTISINHRNSNKTKVVFSVYEVYYNNLEASIDFLAIGRWK